MEKKVQKNMNVFTCSKQVMCPKTSTRRIPIQFQFVCFFFGAPFHIHIPKIQPSIRLMECNRIVSNFK